MNKITVYIKNIMKNSSANIMANFSKWAIIGSIVGLFTGIASAIFLKSLEFVTSIRINNPWILFLLPIGGALVSFLYHKYGGDSLKGNNLVIDKINGYDGNVPLRMAPLVFLGTITTHLFGGSAGREGTGVQIASSIAEGIGRILKLDEIDKKIILMAGVSSGFGSIFGTPLAGTIFGLEIATIGAMSYEALIPCFIAAFVSNLVTRFCGIEHISYIISNTPELSFLLIVKIVFAAIIFGLASKFFSELTHKLKVIFSSKFKNKSIKSFVGGIIIIIFTYLIGTRDYLGLSIPLISDSFNGSVNPFAFILKMLFTSLTLGTGFQGGEVTPLFVIGSTLGNTLGWILNISPSFLASLGLIGIFAGATNAPITSFILGIEMFGAQGSIYMFMVCAISYLFSGHSGIYSSQKITKSKSKSIKISSGTRIHEYRKNRKKLL